MGPSSVVVWWVVLVCVCAHEPKIYDAYFGKPVTPKRETFLSQGVNSTILCTVPVRPCRKDEGRRVDGTCTNPKYPSRGAKYTPFPRLLPPKFGIGNALRSAHDGSPLPSARVLRTALLGDGQVRGTYFSTLSNDVFAFALVDSVDLLYMFRYIPLSPCCPNNRVPVREVPPCIAIEVQADDPYLRRTGIRCMNLTRVETYQDFGCIPQSYPAERYNRQLPMMDLSMIYGNSELRNKQIRSGTDGLLAFRMEEDREVPLGVSPFCLGNRPQNMETACYDFGDNHGGNIVPSVTVVALWFFREHNRLARELTKLNPCWDDDHLFEAARKINIAQFQYIFYYEMIPDLLGRQNALDSGVIHDAKGYVNDFDYKSEPGIYIEYLIGTRWFHTYQAGYVDLYRNKSYVGSRPIADDLLRPGVLALNNTEADHTFRNLVQPADRFDYILDHDLGIRAVGEWLAASDVGAIDIMRARDAGLPPYNAYRKLCGLKYAHTFEDLHDTIDVDKVEDLSRYYEVVDDVDLMVGIYMERMIPGGFVGPTLYCIITHNLLLWRHSDKFFFEHGGFPAALTEPQLKEVRKTGIGRIMCDNGIDVTHVRPYPFLAGSPWNDFISCKKVPGIDLTKWKDRNCAYKHEMMKRNKEETKRIQPDPQPETQAGKQ